MVLNYNKIVIETTQITQNILPLIFCVMNKTLNKVILIGNLGKDPEIRYLETGISFARFSLATSENYTDKKTGKTITQTDWHNIIAWRGLSDVVEKHLKKGDRVYIEGKIRGKTYQDKEGLIRYTVDIIANDIIMLGSNNKKTENTTNKIPKESSFYSKITDKTSNKIDEEEDILPF